MIDIHIADPVHPIFLERIREKGFRETDATHDARGLVVRSRTRVTEKLLREFPQLELIVRAGVGLDTIDLDATARRDILVRNTPKASSMAVAELTFAHIFALFRGLPLSFRDVHPENFPQMKKAIGELACEVNGKVLAVIGTGNIGRLVMLRAIGLGMKVLPVDPQYREIELTLENPYFTKNVTIPTVNLDDALRHADVVSLHVPGQSTPLLTEEKLRSMKTGSFLINTSRGSLLDEEAVLKLLESGHLAGAGLDVYQHEPHPNPRLLHHPKISPTPHIGAETREAQERIGLEIFDHFITHFGGGNGK